MADSRKNKPIRFHIREIMHWFVLSTIALISVDAQELASIHAKHQKQFQSYTPYYSTGYYPNTKFKPGSAYKATPALYNPSDICFNPNYYGFLNTGEGISQTSPVPQPNIYYVSNGNDVQPSSTQAGPAWPPYQYTPFIWNNYPYAGNPNPQFESPSIDTPSSSSSRTQSTPIETHQRSNTEQQNGPLSTPKSIKISRPTVSVKIVPPTFNNNATSITNIAPSLSPLDIERQDTKLSETNRKMIKKLLEIGGRFLKSKQDRQSNKDASTVSSVVTDEEIGANPLATDNEMVMLPSGKISQSNEYPLPKDVFGDKNEPSCSFERMKILTEFNPAD